MGGLSGPRVLHLYTARTGWVEFYADGERMEDNIMEFIRAGLYKCGFRSYVTALVNRDETEYSRAVLATSEPEGHFIDRFGKKPRWMRKHKIKGFL